MIKKLIIFWIKRNHRFCNFTKKFPKVFCSPERGLAESFDRIDELHKKGAGLRGVKTGFVDLDTMLSGMQQSNLLILAARPGQGKTAMIVNIAQHAAVVDRFR